MRAESVGLNDAVPLGEVYDVVVVGSGGAGLTAALAAAVNGARVLVMESAHRFGGSTSVSGGRCGFRVTIGPGILSPGMTLGLALTWGWLAGTTAAAKPGAVG